MRAEIYELGLVSLVNYHRGAPPVCQFQFFMVKTENFIGHPVPDGSGMDSTSKGLILFNHIAFKLQ